MSESVGPGNSVRVRTIVGLVVGVAATATAGILVAVDGGHILAALRSPKPPVSPCATMDGA